MKRPILLTPTTVTATYVSAERKLNVAAAGREDGVQDIRIQYQSLLPISPPVFKVEGQPSTAIGNFPYHVHGQFSFQDNPGKITVETTSGPKTYPVKVVPAKA